MNSPNWRRRRRKACPKAAAAPQTRTKTTTTKQTRSVRVDCSTAQVASSCQLESRKPQTSPKKCLRQPQIATLFLLGLATIQVARGQQVGDSEESTTQAAQLRLPLFANCSQRPSLGNANAAQFDSAVQLHKPTRQTGLGEVALEAGDSNLPEQSLNFVGLLRTNNSVVMFRPNMTLNSPGQQQVAFERVCSGWRNSLQPSKPKQAGYWALDRRRGALIAKFDYYEQKDWNDLIGHEAKLSSPVFHPIPAYHFAPTSQYFNTCTFSFSFYLTINAQLDLTLFPVATSDGSAPGGQQRQAQVVAEQAQGIVLETIALDRSRFEAISRQFTGASFERETWQRKRVPLPHELGPNAPYLLEFSAVPATIRGASIQQHSHLNGLAIANFSFAPECFGVGVEEAELRKINFSPPKFVQSAAGDGDNAAADDEAAADGEWRGDFNLAARQDWLAVYFEGHKVSILIGIMLALVLLGIATLWVICAHLQAGGAQPPARPKKPSGWRLLCCFANKRKPISRNSGRSSFASPFGAGARLSGQRNRVYATQSAFSSDTHNQLLAKHSNFDSLSPSPLFASATQPNSWYGNNQHSPQAFANGAAAGNCNSNYLRPLSASLFEDVELIVNPNYVCGGGGGAGASRHSLLFAPNASPTAAAHLHTPKQLEPYHIDRSQLTLTRPLGKGAFGEVYQGYLVCHESVDGQTIAPRRQQTQQRQANGSDGSAQPLDTSDELDSLGSISKKVAVKTLTDERMSQADFVREALNMSYVSHRNIVELIGVCFEEKPLYIIMELMPGGNLKNFLLKNRDKEYSAKSFAPLPPPPPQHHLLPPPAGGATAPQHKQPSRRQRSQEQATQTRLKLCMGDLLVFALDIARACDFLQKRQFIHRDLAARNCLLTTNLRAASAAAAQVGQLATGAAVAGNSSSLRSFRGGAPSALDVNANHKVDLDKVYLNGFCDSSMVAKLADFGMTRDIYSNDYYRTCHKEMPVRWMPPECLDGVATTKSDVWSFGVFLWELFSMGQLPYQNLLDNHQVIEFIRSRRHATRPQRRPSSALDELPTGATGSGAERAAAEEPIELASVSDAADLPPLPRPHENTPLSVYAIMCACWASCPENRPQFEEIANRLYWCLQMDDVLATSLPCFYEQQSPREQHSHERPARRQGESLDDNDDVGGGGYQNQSWWLDGGSK